MPGFGCDASRTALSGSIMNTVSEKPNPLKKGSPGRIIPGFRITLGFTVFYLSLIILLPLSALVLNTFAMDWNAFIQTVTSPRVVTSYKLSFGASLIAGLVNVFFGTILTWVLVRYRFPGRRIIDALIDLPFALPTAVAGIALTALYSQNGWIGRYLEYWGIKVAFTPVGVTVALIFIGLPFIVRTLQPVLEELEATLEEAAASLGADRIQTFARVIFPAILPAVITGFTLAFARALGEYGSVIFIAGNMPMVSEITPLFIVIKLEQYDYAGATAIAAVMLLASFLLLLAINLLQAWVRRRNDGA
jgi:sulfate/thiosulfate transport system permease protein